MLLVIKEAVEKLSNSALEKEVTFWNTLSLKFLPNEPATLDDKNPTVIEAIIPRKAINNIIAPIFSIYLD